MTGSYLPRGIGLAPVEPHEIRLAGAKPSNSILTHFELDLNSIVQLVGTGVLHHFAHAASNLLGGAAQYVMLAQGSGQNKSLAGNIKNDLQEKINSCRKIISDSIKKHEVEKLCFYWQIAKKQLINQNELLSSLFVQLDADHNNSLLLAAKHGSLSCLSYCFEEIKQSLSSRNARNHDVLQVAKHTSDCLDLIIELVEYADEQGFYQRENERV